MATFNLQNNVVNAFFLNVDVERQFVALLQRSITTLKGQKVLAKCITMAMLKLHSGVKRDVAKSCKIWFISIFDGWVFFV